MQRQDLPNAARNGGSPFSAPPDEPVTVRLYTPLDADACKVLYSDGLLGGQLSENDTGIDIDDIEQAYTGVDGNGFWVAVTPDGAVVGMIGVQQEEAGVAEIRRLRVRKDVRRRGIGSKLLETALGFCTDRGYLKITLDTFIEREPAIRLFEKFHFRPTRVRQVNGRELLYFYLDIYGQERKKA